MSPFQSIKRRKGKIIFMLNRLKKIITKKKKKKTEKWQKKFY